MRDSVWVVFGIHVFLFKGNVVALNYTYCVLRQPRRMVCNLFRNIEMSSLRLCIVLKVLPNTPYCRPYLTLPYVGYACQLCKWCACSLVVYRQIVGHVSGVQSMPGYFSQCLCAQRNLITIIVTCYNIILTFVA